MRPVLAIVALAVIITAVVIILLATSTFGGTDEAEDPGTGDVGELTLVVPIEISGAEQVGGLQLELLYNESVLQFESAAAGSLAQNALLETDGSTPGTLRVGLVDAAGINGDGALVNVTFEVVAASGPFPSALGLANVEVSDVNLRDLVVTPNDGAVSSPDLAVSAPGLDLSN